MRIPWNRITPTRFEALALEFAADEFPQHDWTPTPRTRDGNRDAEASQTELVLDREVEYEHWMEAKFHHKEGKPSRSQLDPTLVSGLIAPSVRAILFVTNGRISEQYMFRAERAFNRPPDRFVAFREGPDVAEWLVRNSHAAIKFFGSRIEPSGPALPTLEIVGVSILDPLDYRRGFYRPVSKVALGRSYLLHVVVRSQIECNATIALSQPAPLALVDGRHRASLSLERGTNTFCLPAYPEPVGRYLRGVVLVRTDRSVATKSLSKRIEVVEDRSIKIAFAAQIKLAARLKDLSRARFGGGSINSILFLSGPAGVGKSHTLDLFESDLSLETDSLRLTFTGQEGHDGRRLCELILFLHFGPAAVELESLDPIIVASSRPSRFLGDALLKRLIAGAADGAEAQSLFRDLLSMRDPRQGPTSLVEPLPTTTSTVVIADDIHKLSGPTAEIFTTVLRDHFAGNHNSCLLLSGRAGEFQFSRLEIEVRHSAAFSAELSPPTLEEVVEGLERLLDRPCPAAVPSVLRESHFSTLTAVNLLTHMRERCGLGATEPELLEVFEAWRQSATRGHDKTVLEAIKRSEDLFPLLDVVHAVKGGLKIEMLKTAFAEEHIDLAIERRLARLDENGLVWPFHDLVDDAYTHARGRIHGRPVGQFLVAALGESALEPDRALPALLKCGATFQAAFLEMAIAQRDSFLSVSRYGPALDIARSIVAALEASRARGPAFTEAVFTLADCLNHCSVGPEARSRFIQARGPQRDLWSSPTVSGAQLEAQAELFSLDFWDLDVGQSSGLDDFASRLSALLEERPDLRDDPRIRRAFLTSLNRQMTFALLQDRPSNGLLDANITQATALGAPNYVAFALVDHAKGSYHDDVAKSEEHLQRAHTAFGQLGNEHRRLLTSAAELAFLRCRSGREGVSALQDASDALAHAGLWPEHLNCLLKLASVELVNNRPDGAAVHLAEFYRRRPAANDDRRRQFLVANIEAAAAYLRHDLKTSAEWTGVHLSMVDSLGASYRNVARINSTVLSQNSRAKKSRVSWFSVRETNKDAFHLDPRVW